MGHGKKVHHFQPKRQIPVQVVDSLLDNMKDGNEYGSIVSLVPKDNLDLVSELIRAIKEIEAIRNRPCISYIGNVVNGDGSAGVDQTDDLPFHELIAQVPADQKKVDVFVATNGGSAHQISRFVNALRARFDEVDFLIPSYCMSAGTIFVLSGDHIWMTSRACLGPIDPQVPSKDGRLVPAQALLHLVQQLEKEGKQAQAKGKPVPWTAVRIVDTIDKKELADAISASNYSMTMAAEYLRNYKFRTWQNHSSTGASVTDKEKDDKANEIAGALTSHDRWKSHGHAITRELLFNVVRLKIDHPESLPGLERAMRRTWALCNWIFDKSTVVKIMVSEQYRHVRNRQAKQGAIT